MLEEANNCQNLALGHQEPQNSVFKQQVTLSFDFRTQQQLETTVLRLLRKLLVKHSMNSFAER